MISKDKVVSKLSPFANYNKIVVEDQHTNDIINGILQNHEKYKSEYDKISELFLGDTIEDTAENVFDFLKSNVKYYIEPIKTQTLRSPAAILAIKQGADCKSYATFINGVFDSLNRKGIYKVPIAYRFASYRDKIKDPQHVFAVLFPNTKNEVWVDPVLNTFNEKKQPTFYKDKNLKMALIAMSGISNAPKNVDQLKAELNQVLNVRDRLLISGAVKQTSAKYAEIQKCIDGLTRQIQNMSISGIDRGDRDYNGDSVSGVFDSINWGDIFNNVVKTTPSIIQASKGTPIYTAANQSAANAANLNAPASKGLGIDTNVILLLALGGLGIYFFTKK